MKKVNIATGGSPVIGDYTLQLQDAFADALKGITSAWGDCIISGCVITLFGGTDYNVSEGWLMWNGEVFHLPAQSISNPLAYPIVVFKTTSTITNPIAYADGLTKDLVVITEVNFKAAATALTGEALLTAFTPLANVAPVIFTVSSPWTTITSPFPNPAYFKQNGRVYMRGAIKSPGGLWVGTNSPFFILPVNFRPQQNKTFLVLGETGFNTDKFLLGYEISWIRIETDGKCYGSLDFGKEIILDNISFEV